MLKKIIKIEKSQLNGEIELSGSKISAIALLVISILTKEKVRLENFPKNLLDVKILLNMLELIGKKHVFEGNAVEIYEEGELKNDLTTL